MDEDVVMIRTVNLARAANVAALLLSFLASPHAGAAELVITQAAAIPPGFFFSGGGGNPQGFYSVLATIDPAAHPTNWVSLTTNQFDSQGGFSFSRSVVPGTTREYFRLMSLPELPLANYFVAPNGSDANSGTNVAAPFATLSKAASVAQPGQLIYLRGGTYHLSSQVSLSRSGTPIQPIRVFGYPGEQALLNFSGTSTGTRGISISGNCWHLKGLEIAYAGDNGIYIGGKSNTVEFCVLHDNEDSGLQLSNFGSAYNRIINCDSYRNYDPVTHGENADGFAAKFDLGPGNIFIGCRAWENSDDGWDLWQATNTVILTNCWTWRNGTNTWADLAFAGDGNGIKLGGNYYFGPHFTYRCLSFRNPGTGFDQNNNNAGQTLWHNTAWANGNRNYNMNHGTNITPHVLCNNLSIAGGVSDAFRTGSRQTNNSWQVISPAPAASDFMSLVESLARSPRQPDGSLPRINFLKPVPGGRLVDKGLPLGEPFFGNAPDLGAFEQEL